MYSTFITMKCNMKTLLSKLWQLVDERFNEEETKFKVLEAAVKNVARDVSLYLERLNVSIYQHISTHSLLVVSCVLYCCLGCVVFTACKQPCAGFGHQRIDPILELYPRAMLQGCKNRPAPFPGFMSLK